MRPTVALRAAEIGDLERILEVGLDIVETRQDEGEDAGDGKGDKRGTHAHGDAREDGPVEDRQHRNEHVRKRLQGARRPLFRRIAAAADDLGLNLVLVHCGRLDPRDADALPGSPVVTDFVPQDRVLERADVAILHGGFNTVLDALVARTPIVAIPLAMEQPAIAARLERAGLGTRLSPHGLTRGRIRRAIRAVLEDRDMPDRLDRMAGEIARAGGAARAAALVEAATLARAPALREPADA